jgi:hypothetical protein
MGDLSVQELVLEPFEVSGCVAILGQSYTDVCFIFFVGEQVLFETTNSTFHSAGREDMDVRMLGKGRPFLVELHDAKVAPSEELFAQIAHWVNTSQGRNCNGDVQIDGLVATDQHAIPLMQEGAEDKEKDYACVVWTKQWLTRQQIQVGTCAWLHHCDWRSRSCPHLIFCRDISAVEQALNHREYVRIDQKTPVRVAHRRSLLVRDRLVDRMEATPLGPNLFILNLTTSAGTYVKEFVHGDLGRTIPSVGDFLGTRADILQLDVLDVHDGVMEKIHNRNASSEAAAAKRARIEEQKDGAAAEETQASPFLHDASDAIRQRWRKVTWEEMQAMRLPKPRTPT